MTKAKACRCCGNPKVHAAGLCTADYFYRRRHGEDPTPEFVRRRMGKIIEADLEQQAVRRRGL